MTNDATLISAILDQARHDGRDAHERVLSLVDDLTDEQVLWRAGGHAPCIGFHVWHLARWADYDLHQFAGVPQIWETRALAAAWGFTEALGQSDTGTEMGDDASERLVLPGKAALLEYAKAAFGAVDEFLDCQASQVLQSGGRDTDPRLVGLIFGYLVHDNRHLGMIEALRGVLDLRGSATN